MPPPGVVFSDQTLRELVALMAQAIVVVFRSGKGAAGER